MDLDEIRAFLAVVDSGSFKAAAESVKQPRATLRRRVEALEARAGVSLLERGRSGVEPTHAGALLAQHGRDMIRETTTLLATMRDIGDYPAGDLRVGLPAGLPPHAMAALFAWSQPQFPRLRIHLRYADDPLADLLDSVDIAVHYGRAAPSGRWISRPLVEMKAGLRASESYIERYGAPDSIEALRQHKLMGWRAPGEDPKWWPTFEGGSFAVEPMFTTCDTYLLRRFAVLGFGVALLPDVNTRMPDLGGRDSQLVPLLDDVVGRHHQLNLAIPEMLAKTPKIVVLMRHVERFIDMVR